MKRSVVSFGLVGLVVLFSTLKLFSQISEGGIPPSFHNPTDRANTIDLRRFQKINIKKIKTENLQKEKNGLCPTAAKFTPVNLNTNNSGTWSNLPDGDKIWRLTLKSEGAIALSVCYDDFYLPKGSKLFLYNENKTQILGAYTHINNPESRIFANELIQGESVTLEYYTPAEVFNSTDKPAINIEKLGCVFEEVALFPAHSKTTGWGNSEYCEINVNCSPEGDKWKKQKRGVAEIFIIEGYSGFWCTGSLINNTANNGTPYFLTAHHCGAETTTDEDLQQMIFYFNYEAISCTTPSKEPSHLTLTGATKIAAGQMLNGSDFFLLELNTTPPSSYNTYYNGWDKSDNASENGVGIHHPNGDIKKISTYASSTVSTTTIFANNKMASNATWEVVWGETTNGHSVTEGGSSGSPLFNKDGLIIGTLSGGEASCDNKEEPDYYGKFSYHWASNGSTSGEQLKPWLDPLYINKETCAGYAPLGTDIQLVEDQNLKINIYPNPASNNIFIMAHDIIIEDIQIYNIYGAFITKITPLNNSTGRIHIDLFSLNEGIYLLNLNHNKGITTKKITVIN